MSDRATITISKRAFELAEKRAAEQGVSPEAYVDELIAIDSLEDLFDQAWIREKIEEGLASPIAGELTRERIAQLVEEGIALAERRK
ncbi:MAG TPA: hypothetical protein VG889_00155 [Rhizomicrobium sp.]|nr:hypothetical protein [Rhizomicrobium sp.]